MVYRRILGAAVALALLAFPAALSAQQGGAEDDAVVARVNGEEIRNSDVMEMASRLPPQYQSQVMQLYPTLVQRLVDFTLAGIAGRAAGLAEDEEIKARIAKAAEQVIREAYLEREVVARMTDEALQASYQDYLADNPPAEELHARHILLETEEEARAAIAELDGGADFAEMAKERSTGPSGPKGGDLGYFTAEQMVPEFSAAAAELEPGQHTAEPTKTQFGWHVIKLEDRRTAAPASFEELEPQLREKLARDSVGAIFQDLRKGAEIEIVSQASGEAAPEQAPAQ
jgi:peptidyl-prolyl cis-trans isomerase C